MNKMDFETKFGCFLTLLILFVMFCIFVLLLGYSGIFWFIITLILGFVIAWNKDETTEKLDNDYFTDEDFLHCKIGEWVSRK